MATKKMAELERLFQALGDATRLRILGLLLTGEVCVCDIHETLKIPQPKASRHLAYLRKSGLVNTRRQGLWIHYRLAELSDPVLGAIATAVRHALTHVDVETRIEADGVRLHATASTVAGTGVEMEALTAAAVAALTIYDMTKALDKAIEIQDVYLLSKTGGKSGDFKRN